MADPVTLLVGTRKGAFIYRGGAARSKWQLEGPLFLGSIVNHLVADPRDGRTLLMAAKTGHLGPTVFRSRDGGKTWTEAKQPPSFRKAPSGEEGRSVESVFWLSPAHASEPGVWYAGTSPPGLFRSADGGVTWQEIPGFNDHLYAQIKHTIVPGPDGAQVHSICVDPTDARHLYIGISIGGVFESMDGGNSWRPLNKGVAADFLPDANVEYGHDPHTLALHALDPQRLYSLAAHQPGGASRRFPHARRWRLLAAPRQGDAEAAGVVDREAAGHVRERRRSGRTLFRHNQRRDLGQR